MEKKAKIVLIGPPGTGKTTIKKVYFEMANPLMLLEHTLEPTKGINSCVYSIFDVSLGVFDLAGQENNFRQGYAGIFDRVRCRMPS